MVRRFFSKKKERKPKQTAREVQPDYEARGGDVLSDVDAEKATAPHISAEPASASATPLSSDEASDFQRAKTSRGDPLEDESVRSIETEHVSPTVSLPDVEQLQNEEPGKENVTMATNDTVDTTLTPEAVAYRLLVDIMEAEGHPLTDLGSIRPGRLTRGKLLDAYRECLEAVRGERPSTKK